MKKTTLNVQNHCVYKTNYHLVLVTKYRKKVINQEVLKRLSELVQERIEAWEGCLLEINAEPDHVNILFELPPKHAVADFVNALKTGTSRRIRNEFTGHINQFYSKPVFWSRSYCVTTCGGAPLEIVRQYIENQKGV